MSEPPHLQGSIYTGVVDEFHTTTDDQLREAQAMTDLDRLDAPTTAEGRGLLGWLSKSLVDERDREAARQSIRAIEDEARRTPFITPGKLEQAMRDTMHLPSLDGHDLDGHWDEWTEAIVGALAEPKP